MVESGTARADTGTMACSAKLTATTTNFLKAVDLAPIPCLDQGAKRIRCWLFFFVVASQCGYLKLVVAFRVGVSIGRPSRLARFLVVILDDSSGVVESGDVPAKDCVIFSACTLLSPRYPRSSYSDEKLTTKSLGFCY